MRKFLPARIVPVTALFLLAACGGPINVQLNSLKLPADQRLTNTSTRTESFLTADWPTPITASASTSPNAPVPDTSGYFVGIAISGGGLRSANFAAACMFHLQQLGLLDRVNTISAVSGGSLPAAYYCTAPDSDWNQQNLQEKLSHRYTDDVIFDLCMPWNMIAQNVSPVGDSDYLAGHFADVMFTRNHHRLTMADLRPDRPRLLLNCADLDTGRPFLLDNGHFDRINSDLTKFPIGYAVTASSAVPGLLEPVTLNDCSSKFTHYIHLVDGGVDDNLGVHCLVDSYIAELARKPDAFPHGALLIVIDAGIPVRGNTPARPVLGLLENIIIGVNVSSHVLLNRASSATLAELVVLNADGGYRTAQLRDFMSQLEHEHHLCIRDLRSRSVLIAHLSLSQLADFGQTDLTAACDSVPTDFNIEPDQVNDLYKAADILFARRFSAVFTAAAADMTANRNFPPTALP